jgi:hypothetical protein
LEKAKEKSTNKQPRILNNPTKIPIHLSQRFTERKQDLRHTQMKMMMMMKWKCGAYKKSPSKKNAARRMRKKMKRKNTVIITLKTWRWG